MEQRKGMKDREGQQKMVLGGSSIMSTETDSVWFTDLRRMVWINVCFT